VRCRCWRNAATFEGLSALTQLTRLATDYDSSTQREAQYSQLAQLTGLRELDAPRVLQTDGEKAVPPTLLHQTLRRCATCSLDGRMAHMLDHSRVSVMQLSRDSAQLVCHQVSRIKGVVPSTTGQWPTVLRMCRHVCADDVVQADAARAAGQLAWHWHWRARHRGDHALQNLVCSWCVCVCIDERTACRGLS
jgi:hypothetical protein